MLQNEGMGREDIKVGDAGKQSSFLAVTSVFHIALCMQNALFFRHNSYI